MAIDHNYIPRTNVLKNTRRGPVYYKKPEIEIINVDHNMPIRKSVTKELNCFLNMTPEDCFKVFHKYIIKSLFSLRNCSSSYHQKCHDAFLERRMTD